MNRHYNSGRFPREILKKEEESSEYKVVAFVILTNEQPLNALQWENGHLN